MASLFRFYEKKDLLPLMKKHRKDPVVVFDLETNGLRPENSILSCSAVKMVLDGTEGTNTPMRRLAVFDRYYFPVEPENPSALRVNGLFHPVIEAHRSGRDWPRFFKDDPDFQEFCADAGLFVAHNIDFDAQFLPFLRGRDQFCTMKSNTTGKFPRLSELAAAYGIETDAAALHGSLYDTEVTAGIFLKMVGEILPDIEQGDLFF
jgi:DNA polymerase-3 subunit epsilon